MEKDVTLFDEQTDDPVVKTPIVKITKPPPQLQSKTPMELLTVAVSQNFDLDKLSLFMDLQERHENQQAKKAYNAALVKFKKTCPKVYKDKENKQYNSWYTSIGSLVNSVTEKLTDEGLNIKWETKYLENKDIEVSCIMTHVDGHSESTSFSAPLDTSGSKNPVQQRKSTNTYLRIITFENITGIISEEGNLDDDGNGGNLDDPITKEQYATLELWINKTNINKAKFLEYFEVASLDVLPKKDFNRALQTLQNKVKK